MRTIARKYRWAPYEMSKLFLDDLDMYGVFFWEWDAMEYDKEVQKSTKK
ncbi:MAG: hypothetical protein PF486_06120 [Prolixibacteraceae bacterium]|nr:hypothetical protein [Prolixibacteraceae bacterium]